MELLLKGPILIIVFSFARGINLQGDCPKVPPSQSIPWRLHWPHHIIRNVPFALDKPTHLFQDKDPTVISGFTVQFVDNSQLAESIVLSFDLTEEDPANLVRSIGDQTGGSYTLNTSIYKLDTSRNRYLPANCFNVIVEEVKVWFDTSFLFLYSCATLKNGTHDVALMILDLKDEFYNFYSNVSLTEGGLRNLTKFAQKYLSQQLFEKIDWSYSQYTPATRPYLDPFKCPLHKSADISLIFILVFILLLTVIGLVFWYLIKNV